MASSGATLHARPQRDLAQLLLTLPQELFDRIYIETFTAERQTVKIRRGRYTPPKLLSISRDSRTLFASSYYANTLFRFGEFRTCCIWLETREAAHRGMLTKITVARSPVWESLVRSMIEKQFGQGLGAKVAFVDLDQVSSWMLGSLQGKPR